MAKRPRVGVIGAAVVASGDPLDGRGMASASVGGAGCDILGDAIEVCEANQRWTAT